ncbi:MAG: hypothetical protein KAS17_07700 [Victivallaceae bacterium]|nr:hypothetical protein [Victivallaceae bacterium]
MRKPNNMTKIKRVTELRAKCLRLDLEATDAFWLCPIENLANIYNGAGPDWLPNWTRTILSFILRLFGPAFLIHDFDFELSDKTRKGFNLVNKRMWRNIRKILSFEYPLTRFHLWKERAYWWGKGFLAYRACVRGGWSAWLDDTPDEKEEKK